MVPAERCRASFAGKKNNTKKRGREGERERGREGERERGEGDSVRRALLRLKSSSRSRLPPTDPFYLTEKSFFSSFFLPCSRFLRKRGRERERERERERNPKRREERREREEREKRERREREREREERAALSVSRRYGWFPSLKGREGFLGRSRSNSFHTRLRNPMEARAAQPPPPRFYKLYERGAEAGPPPPGEVEEGQFTTFGTIYDVSDGGGEAHGSGTTKRGLKQANKEVLRAFISVVASQGQVSQVSLADLFCFFLN